MPELLRAPLSFFGRARNGQLYFVQIAQRFSASAIPVAYQLASDRLAPRVFAPILKVDRLEYYICTKMLLEQYQAQVLRDRKGQLQDIKDKEFQEKLIAFGDAGLGVLSLVIPYFRIGELLVTTLCLTAASIAVHCAQGINGSKDATEAIFREDILGLLMDAGLETIMPGWAKFAFKANEKASTVYKLLECKDNSQTQLTTERRVPADSSLDQIYRFRCMIDPTLPKQIEKALKDNHKLMAAVLENPPMTPERWQQVKDTFAAVVAATYSNSAKSRSAFLTR